ncbi:hypothetical protein CDAR_35381 [Caerostris darwini]|uniref:Uncharacterized protein n=1 Tax=Caerostris darwini TaxID=1538125 RepID=A0AAV4SJW0_9ARAC|nr:hypothetical protein CDAR_35381 [Caerostris darwini]
MSSPKCPKGSTNESSNPPRQARAAKTQSSNPECGAHTHALPFRRARNEKTTKSRAAFLSNPWKDRVPMIYSDDAEEIRPGCPVFTIPGATDHMPNKIHQLQMSEAEAMHPSPGSDESFKRQAEFMSRY